MRRSFRGTLSALDALILASSVLLGLFWAYVTDREYANTRHRSVSRDGTQTRLPIWLKQWRRPAIRLMQGSSALLAGVSYGIVLVGFRPRRKATRAARKGAGHVAAALTALLTSALFTRWCFFPGLRRLPPSELELTFLNGCPFGYFFNQNGFWLELRPEVTAAILGAWLTLAVLGFWRAAEEPADRLGRGLGVGWFVVWGMQGMVYLIAWC